MSGTMLTVMLVLFAASIPVAVAIGIAAVVGIAGFTPFPLIVAAQQLFVALRELVEKRPNPPTLDYDRKFIEAWKPDFFDGHERFKPLVNEHRAALTRVTSGGAPVYIWPGGCITFMVDVTRVPENAFGYVPTPALVAPVEFTMRLDDYAALGGHLTDVRSLESLGVAAERPQVAPHAENPWPLLPAMPRRRP